MILDKLRENRVPNRFEENNEQLRNRIKHYAYTAN